MVQVCKPNREDPLHGYQRGWKPEHYEKCIKEKAGDATATPAYPYNFVVTPTRERRLAWEDFCMVRYFCAGQYLLAQFYPSLTFALI